MHFEWQVIKFAMLTSRIAERGRGSNIRPSAFLRTSHFSLCLCVLPTSTYPPRTARRPPSYPTRPSHDLLFSRGFDFTHSIKHIIVVGFLHRGGRTGRASAWSKIIISG